MSQNVLAPSTFKRDRNVIIPKLANPRWHRLNLTNNSCSQIDGFGCDVRHTAFLGLGPRQQLPTTRRG